MNRPPGRRSPRADLTDGPVGARLVRLALPTVGGLLAILLFNLADTLFVGWLGPRELAAMSYTFPVTSAVMSVAMGMATAMAVTVAGRLGAGDEEGAQVLTTQGLLLANVLVLLVAAAGYATMDRVFGWLGATPALLPFIRSYMEVWYLAVGLLVLPMVGNGAVRATGDTTSPSLIMVMAGGVNVLLDPLFIFGWGPVPAMGLRGAALATAVAWASCFAAGAYLVGGRKRLLTRRHLSLRRMLSSWRELLAIALPASTSRLVMPLAGGLLTRLLSAQGESTVAAWGIAQRLESLVMVGPMAMGAALIPFVGQSRGAGRIDRVRAANRFTLGFGLAYGLVVALGLTGWLAEVGALFSSSPAVVSAFETLLGPLLWSYGLMGLWIMVGATMNALERPLAALALVVLRLWILVVPLAALGNHLAGLGGFAWGIAAANVASGAAAWTWVCLYDRPALAVRASKAAAASST